MSNLHPKVNLFSQNELIKAYTDMLFIRRFEERCGQAYGNGLIAGFCHLYIGQEAIAVGVRSAIRTSDSIITSYRDHGHIIQAGTDPKSVMAELFGKSTGSSKGKGGSMHLFDLSRKFYGGHGIVGAQIPLGTGIAFTNKYNGTDDICVTFFGDGACNQGQFYESMNIAKLQNLPVLYVLENNLYSMGTSNARGCANHEHLFERGQAFGVPGKKIDGMDIFTIKEEFTKAIEYVRTNGPMLLELNTYRYRGHSMSDPAKYRTKEEVEKCKIERDPIDGVMNYMLEHKIITQEKLDEIEIKVSNEVKSCYAFAEQSPEPELAELYTDVYV